MKPRNSRAGQRNLVRGKRPGTSTQSTHKQVRPGMALRDLSYLVCELWDCSRVSQKVSTEPYYKSTLFDHRGEAKQTGGSRTGGNRHSRRVERTLITTTPRIAQELLTRTRLHIANNIQPFCSNAGCRWIAALKIERPSTSGRRQPH